MKGTFNQMKKIKLMLSVAALLLALSMLFSGCAGSTEVATKIDTTTATVTTDIYKDASPALSYAEALERSRLGLLSGLDHVPDQAPQISEYRPMQGDAYIRNNEPWFIDENTYVVVDACGNEVLRVYRGGAYITLEEVAAYVYAFGDVPANYVNSKKTQPEASIWGEYLRLNHSAFSGNTEKYPYEPVLPNISGCGGEEHCSDDEHLFHFFLLFNIVKKKTF